MTPQTPSPKVARALLSVSDKRGLVELGRGLHALGIELVASGGTAAALQKADLPVVEVADLTASPEMLGGRVKTLHPKIHGGILARRELESDRADMAANDISPIDLVVVNLYPFEATVAKADTTRAEAVEKIDIGGPSMIRSAAKNHAHVAVLVDPDDYEGILQELKDSSGELALATRQRLAVKAFERTAAYDAAIHGYLARQEAPSEDPFPPRLSIELSKAAPLRYGENPHQRAAVYGSVLDIVEPLHGKELSYNNLVDVQAALALILEFDPGDSAAVGILKHNTPCGVGAGENPLQAYQRAFATDPDSPFGGIVIANRAFDLGLAQEVDQIFTEVLIAPSFDADALALLRKKKNRRLVVFRPERIDRAEFEWRRVYGGMLVQEPDVAMEDVKSAPAVTARKPNESELRALDFGWRVAKHVKSNAIVFCGPDRTLGVQGGATSRVDAVHASRDKAARVGNDLKGSVVASDAFFPFPDGLETAVAAGATAVVQPGGSTRDEEVIAAADRLGIAMVFTGTRHFRH